MQKALLSDSHQEFGTAPIVGAVRNVFPEPCIMLPDNVDRTDVDNLSMCGKTDPVGYSYIERFERELCQQTGAKHALALANGTSALHLALVVAGVGPGDIVIVPTLTFAACAAVVTYCGAHPCFVDCNLAPFGAINLYKLQRYLQGFAAYDRRRIKALIAVDLLGYPCVSPILAQWCANEGIFLIEDAAAALGSRSTTPLADLTAVSFNVNKIVTTGSGGALLCRHTGDYERARHLATTAKRPSPWYYDHDAVGYNYRLANMCAALGLGQLQRLPELVQRKRALHARYLAAFASCFGADLLRDDEKTGRHPNYWLNAVLIDTRLAHKYTQHRDDLLATLTRAGYGCRAIYTPLHMQEPYRDCLRMQDLRVAEDIFRRTVCLPSGIAI